MGVGPLSRRYLTPMKDWRIGSAVCIVVGAAIGMAFGVALGNPIGLGGVGAAIGIALYLAIRGRL